MKRLLLSISAVAMLTLSGCDLLSFLTGSMSAARIRVIHASPDAPAVDVCVNGAVAFAGAAFSGATDYASLDPDTYAIRVVPSGDGCDTAGVINANLPLAAHTDTTVIAVGLLADIEPLVLTDDNSSPQAGNAKVRFVHAGPDAPTVDITLTDGTPLFDDISFRENGGYIEVAAGTYNLQVRDETGTTVVLPLNNITLDAGTVYTITAIGLLAGNPDLDALITVDN